MSRKRSFSLAAESDHLVPSDNDGIVSRDVAEVGGHRLAVLTAPEFNVAAPEIIGIEHIPPKALTAMGRGWHAQNFPARTITIDRVFDVFVTSEGLVFTKDLELIQQTRTQHPEAAVQAGRDRIAGNPNPAIVEQDTLLMRKKGEANYGHWMIEMLPRLNLVSRFTSVESLAVPQTGGPLDEVIKDSIDIIQPDHPPRHARIGTSVTFYRSLILVTGLSVHGQWMSSLVLDDVDKLLASAESRDLKRIYVARPGMGRNVSNFASLLPILDELDFAIVDPGSMSLQEQIATFRNAEVVTGVMGAAMTNIMFSPRGAKVLNIAPGSFPDIFFFLIAAHRGQTYAEIRGPNDDGSALRDVPFHIDPAAFEQKLREMCRR